MYGSLFGEKHANGFLRHGCSFDACLAKRVPPATIVCRRVSLPAGEVVDLSYGLSPLRKAVWKGEGPVHEYSVSACRTAKAP